MNRDEDSIQRAVFQHFAVRSAPGVFAFHPANGGYRKPIEAGILKGLGVRSGVPDVIAIKDGQTYALELKTARGALSDNQRQAIYDMACAGAHVSVAYGLNHALKTLEEWGLLKGRAL